jgi:2,4-dienoyl-CoA reductase-like NADH-dependent reductase (Old Yellow Enzyme family)
MTKGTRDERYRTKGGAPAKYPARPTAAEGMDEGRPNERYSDPMNRSTHALFTPCTINRLVLSNRIVMAPMTRASSPGGVPGADVAAYYRRRAEGGVGLIVTEGAWIPHPSAGFTPRVPRLFGDDALAGWRHVVEQVHAAGGRIFPQLWHVGSCLSPGDAPSPDTPPVGPSGIAKPAGGPSRAMTQTDIDAVIEAYAQATECARAVGFDGVEIHAAHGYLIDQFFYEATNQRTDQYGGDIIGRTRFAVEIVREMRRRAGADFPIVLRYSQWKLHEYGAKPLRSPDEMERFLTPLVDAGVDAFHCSTRRFWEPEFEGSAMNLAGWTKKLTGKPTITVGSVSLSDQLLSANSEAATMGIDELLDRLEQREFDFVAIGRALVANPSWAAMVKAGKVDQLKPFDYGVLSSLT